MKYAALFRSSTLLGVGLGGFFDGIVLHQILGWHHMICRTETCRPDSIAQLQQQSTEDGWFHFAMWLVTIAGVVCVYRSAQRGIGRVAIAGSFAGFGCFNFFEGLIDHEILGIHHVLPASPHWLLYDLLFLASGLILMAGGYWAAKRVR